VTAEVTVIGPHAGWSLPGLVATSVYRIVQEALTNVAKHAEARQVSVLLERPVGELRLIIEDDGRGFDVDETAGRSRYQRRLGLASIRERAVLVGGTLDVESNPGRGTAIYLRIPLPQEQGLGSRV
jgi:signal transduction histidine kinase